MSQAKPIGQAVRAGEAAGRHPVTRVAYEDAVSYAARAGKAIATETEGSTRRAAGSG
jgi:formylglycine-generating enzyme required for sulfatase activity